MLDSVMRCSGFPNYHVTEVVVIQAKVLDAHKDREALLGDFEFIQLPSPHDFLTLPGDDEIGRWRVVSLVHSPRRAANRSKVERDTSEVAVLVEWR
jgi:hypothetical protein